MIDIKYIRENPQFVKDNCKRRGSDADIDEIAEIDAERRTVQTRVEQLRADRNRLSKECGKNPEAREQVKAMKEELAAAEQKEAELGALLDEKLSWLPNILDPAVPDGDDDQANKEIRVVGDIPKFYFKVKDHVELG